MLYDTLNVTKQTAKGNIMSKKSPTLHDQSQKITAFLEKMGAYLQTHQTPKTYQKVDLSGKKGMQHNAFYQQKGALSSHLLGQKAGMVQNLANKLLPQGVLEDWSQSLYLKLANLAKSWALYSLSKDSRFGQELSATEQQVFAQEIANQNRALAALGAITQFLGLKGVVLDSAWLLMVSLRSVYQLAFIYHVPLSGKEGVELAYEILSGANLDKLQQKQVILTALALGDKVLANAQNTGLKASLSQLLTTYPLAGAYNKQFDELSKYVNLDNLDKFNPSWLHYICPITAVAIGSYYNNELIDEVLGTALATFAKDTPLLTQNAQDG